MATVIHERFDVAPLSGFRISWGGIWAGVLTVMGTLLFLTTLGFAIGVSAIDPGQTDASTFGTGAAIWSGLSLLIALFESPRATIYIGASRVFPASLIDRSCHHEKLRKRPEKPENPCADCVLTRQKANARLRGCQTR